MILDEQEPFHRLGLPPTDSAADEAADLGVDLAATPSFDEIVALYATRMARVGDLVAAVTDDRLGQIRTWGEESQSVAECLGVVLNEHCEHRRFAVRDLTVLEDR
jgi:hypothetical protein